MLENNNRIEIESISLSDLFKKKLVIPAYQRPYVWTNFEIDKLLNQIKEHEKRKIVKGEKPNFYLGGIVLHKSGEDYNVIDGQQRITTMQILHLIKKGISYNTGYSHPISIKQIQVNYEVFKQKSFYIINFDKINVTVITTQSEDMAYNFFETLNTGGKRLSGTDILKAHHLRSVADNYERNAKALEWEKKHKNLEKVNRILSKIRRMNYFKNDFVPDKFTNDDKWKNLLTEDFADKVEKGNRDVGYSFVEIEENTHKITAGKYAIRQPLNEGLNYINYLLNFTNDYNYLFEFDISRTDKYSQFTNKIINVIDGTADLRHFYQIVLLCYVDRFGKKNILEFCLYLFKFIYSLRLSVQSRVYEATVRNFINDKKIIERILYAFTYEEILGYLKDYEYSVTIEELSGVKKRFYDRVNTFFNCTNFDESYNQQLTNAIDKYLNN